MELEHRMGEIACLWQRRFEPEGSDLRQAIAFAESAAAGSCEATKLLTGRIVEDMAESLKWTVVFDGQSECHALATAASQAQAWVCDEVAGQLRAQPGDYLVLGSLGLELSVFAGAALLTTPSATLVRLSARQPLARTGGPTQSSYLKVVELSPHAELLLRHSTPAALGSLPIRLPTLPLVAVETSLTAAASRSGLAALAFACASSQLSDRWEETVQLSRQLGYNGSPRHASIKHRLADRLKVKLGPVERIAHQIALLRRR